MEKRIKIASKNKTPDWTLKDLNKVLKLLKKEKARVPMGWPNELFRSENAGDDLKKSILNLMNCIKNEQSLPKILRSPDITSIFKKGN